MKKIFTAYLIWLFLAWSISNVEASVILKTSSSIEVVSHNPQVEVNAYPNPFKDAVTLEIIATNVKPTVLKIYDIIGVEKLVIDLEDFSGSGHYRIQIKDLNEGIYFCNIYSHSRLLESKKLVCSK